MTIQEFNNEFDIAYDSIAGASAPGIDIYEKSLYLTKAQLEIVKNYYDSTSNRKQRGFEGSEKRRVDLRALIKDYKSSASFTDSSAINSNSRFFNIPSDTFVIINEKVKVLSGQCLVNNIIEIKPITHDEYNLEISNPFKNPDDSLVWRMDMSNIASNKVVEIISTLGQLEYQLRYLKYPKPIILADLSTTYPSETLTIDGLSTPSTSELNEEIHREILDRAVELALRDYKPEGLESKVQIDTRNE